MTGRRGLGLALAAVALGLGALAAWRLRRAPDATALQADLEARFTDVRWIDGPGLAAALDAPTPPLVLDARAPAEFAVSHIASAVWIDPDAPDLAALTGREATPLVVYCSVGYRSGLVAQRLQAAGFRDVRNLTGGVFAWARDGRPLVQGSRAVRVVHPFDERWGQLVPRDLWAWSPETR